MRSQSTAKAREKAARRALIQRMIDESTDAAERRSGMLRCRLCDVVATAARRDPEVLATPFKTAPAPRCQGHATGLHERRKRSSQGSLVNPANLVPACNIGNGWVEDWPIQAHRLGLVVRPGDDEWFALAASNDPDQPFSAPESNERTEP